MTSRRDISVLPSGVVWDKYGNTITQRLQRAVRLSFGGPLYIGSTGTKQT